MSRHNSHFYWVKVIVEGPKDLWKAIAFRNCNNSNTVLSYTPKGTIAHEQTPSPIANRKTSYRPCFEGRIKATLIGSTEDENEEVIEPLHCEEDSKCEVNLDSQGRRTRWLRQSISVDGERISGKLLQQCSLDVSLTTFLLHTLRADTTSYLRRVGNI